YRAFPLQESFANSLELVKEKWSSYKNQCLDIINSTPPATGLVCNRSFDFYACWPDGFPGTTVNVSCPWFLPWYRKDVTFFVFHSCLQNQYGRILSKLRIVYTVGYSLSLGALLLALGILISFRGAVVMMQYSVMANNYWLLVEGIYLHSLLVITVFSEKKYFYIYLAIGWGAPLIFVLPWITVKYLYENEECWERNINMGYWWIIRSPILFAYLINFFIFIRIIKILMSKLRAHQMRYTDYKFRLAKSTLTLIPLLGIHAILFTFVIDESVPKGSMLRLIRLFCDLLFNSFQFLIICAAICFPAPFVAQVQSEMVKKWKRWKQGKDIYEEYRHTHSQTPHVKSGSIVTANLPDLQENSVSNPSTDSPQLNQASRHPPCSAAPEENRRLVVSYSNGMGKGRSSKSRQARQFTFTPQRGGTRRCSATEDISLGDRVQFSVCRQDGDETSV
uniref:Glucagon receptor b n=1 Tax=Cyprinodon variegatus TaxID=28743 RepID=A0A3Q2EB15_CYPVA